MVQTITTARPVAMAQTNHSRLALVSSVSMRGRRPADVRKPSNGFAKRGGPVVAVAQRVSSDIPQIPQAIDGFFSNARKG